MRPIASRLLLTDLRRFIVLANELHFGRASEQLGIAQPALSRSIGRLEETVGVQLLERSSRSVALSEAGRLLLAGGDSALATLDRAVDAARATLVKSSKLPLCIGYVTAAEGLAYQLLDRCRDFLRREVDLSIGSSIELVQSLRAKTLDLAFIRPPCLQESLDLTILGTESVICAMPLDYPLSGQTRICLQDLNGARWIRYDTPVCTTFQRDLEAIFRCNKIELTDGPKARHTSAMLTLVATGHGITFIPAYAGRNPVQGVVFAAIDELPDIAPMAIVCRSGERRHDIKKMIEIAVVELKYQ